MESDWPVPGRKEYYWAYIHRDDRFDLKIKRLYPTVHEGLNDLEYALAEKREGNDFIWVIIPHIIDADNFHSAVTQAGEWLQKNGYRYNLDGGWYKLVPESLGRFARLQIEK